MTLPNGLPLVTVTVGPLTNFRGVPLTGFVEVRPSVQVVHVASGQRLLEIPLVVPLDSTGQASFELPATDSTGCTRRYWTYVATYTVRGPGNTIGSIEPKAFALPASVPNVDLDKTEPVVSSGGVQVSLPSVQDVGGLTGSISVEELAELLGDLVGVGGPIDGGGVDGSGGSEIDGGSV